jgi:hypothetical protein
MKRCSSPDHPHCTAWVMPGEQACAHGHAQATPKRNGGGCAGSSFDMLQPCAPADAEAVRRCRRAPSRPAPAPCNAPAERPHLHISGFDPRAAGGRQAIKIELRGMPDDCPPQLAMQLQSALLPEGRRAPALRARSLRGDWRPLFVEFSSRGKEHGQYRIDVELLTPAMPAGTATRAPGSPPWCCLVPRADASLAEIHQTFLSTHKNVRVMPTTPRSPACTPRGGGRLDIDVTARNAGHRPPRPGRAGRARSTWASHHRLGRRPDRDRPAGHAPHPHPAARACLVNAEPEAGAQRQMRLFALDECVLGRFELVDPPTCC